MRRSTRKEREFFDLFEEAGANCLRAAGLLERLLEDWPENGVLVREVVDCEHEGDRITHDLIDRLNRGLPAPFDREDVIALASGLDDIVDYIEEVADFLGLYRIEAPMEQAQHLARVLHAATRQISEAVPCLRSLRDITGNATEVHRLEGEGDRIVREAVASLFERGIDPMMVIRWKDIFERLEDAIDATDTAMHVIAGIVIKNR